MASGGVDFLDDASVDGAFSCFVFITVPELETVRGLVAEAYRVLRPGGRFAVLEVHPDSTGVRFTSFQVGEPGRTYRDGEFKPTQLFDGEEVLPLTDVHWTAATMAEVLRSTGFAEVTSRAPLLADAVALAEPAAVARYDWKQERSTPPFIILTGEKPT
jgi:ubiquinone/menaquinone biosynthesis C-methylase UbiE